jgi:hypothetical protein
LKAGVLSKDAAGENEESEEGAHGEEGKELRIVDRRWTLASL